MVVAVIITMIPMSQKPSCNCTMVIAMSYDCGYGLQLQIPLHGAKCKFNFCLTIDMLVQLHARRAKRGAMSRKNNFERLRADVVVFLCC